MPKLCQVAVNLRIQRHRGDPRCFLMQHSMNWTWAYLLALWKPLLPVQTMPLLPSHCRNRTPSFRHCTVTCVLYDHVKKLETYRNVTSGALQISANYSGAKMSFIFKATGHQRLRHVAAIHLRMCRILDVYSAYWIWVSARRQWSKHRQKSCRSL